MDRSKERVRFGYKPPPGIPQFLKTMGVKSVVLKEMHLGIQGFSVRDEGRIILNKKLSDFERLLTLLHESRHFISPSLTELQIWEDDTALYRILNVTPLSYVPTPEPAIQLRMDI